MLLNFTKSLFFIPKKKSSFSSLFLSLNYQKIFLQSLDMKIFFFKLRDKRQIFDKI